VFYDVTTFLYYLLVYTDPSSKPPTPQVVGFFSKEKLSWDSNNLACILVFPPWQKRGFGQIMMGASYELSKWDGRLGGPEKRAFTLHNGSMSQEANADIVTIQPSPDPADERIPTSGPRQLPDTFSTYPQRRR
jgi:hypothetical protein